MQPLKGCCAIALLIIHGEIALAGADGLCSTSTLMAMEQQFVLKGCEHKSTFYNRPSSHYRDVHALLESDQADVLSPHSPDQEQVRLPLELVVVGLL